MQNKASMTIWNVELGLSVHIEAPNGKYIVIDLGSTSTFSPLKMLRNKHIGYLVITHPHLDHFSDIANIDPVKPDVLCRCEDYTHEELIEGVRESDKDTFMKYFEIDNTYTLPVTADKDPRNEETFGGIVTQVFSSPLTKKDNINNHSLITVFSFGTTKIVVCGDNEFESFDYLMNKDNFKSAVKNALILVAPHHGRKSGFYKEFVELVNPNLTIISDTKKVETSNVDAYSQLSRGYSVYDCSSKQTTVRYCLTTRKDGHIKISFNNMGEMFAQTNINI